MSTEKAFYGTEKEDKMKKTLTLLALVAALGIVAMGCDPASKEETATTPPATTDAKTK